MIFSIKQRLIGLSVIIFIIASITLTYFVNDYAKRSSDNAYDKLLIASALTIAGAIQVEKGSVIVELPLAAFDMLTNSERVFYGIWDEKGNLITGYDFLGQNRPLMRDLEPEFIHAVHNSESIRIVSLGHIISSNNQNKWITIRVAETTNSREALSQLLFKQTLIPMICLMIIGLFLISLGLKRALAPLAHLEKELNSRRPDLLEPITKQVPKEIQSLVSTLNDFIARLDDSMKTLASVVADTAHQLKTPLASISAQADVALLETDIEKQSVRIIKIQKNAHHASQLIHQILMDVTISHRLETLTLEPLTLDKMIDELYLQISPDDQDRFSYELIIQSDKNYFMSDRIALREMMVNLVQNALRYSSEDVMLSIVSHSDNSLTIRVLDRGIGISDHLKKQVFERFNRGEQSNQVTGSGLGLAIVKKVVMAHSGSIELLDRVGGGLIVEIHLPDKHESKSFSMAHASKAFQLSCSVIMICFMLAGFSQNTYAQVNGFSGLQTRFSHDQVEKIDTIGSALVEDDLVIAGTTDTPIFAHLIKGFITHNPNKSVRYIELSTFSLYEGIVNNTITPAVDIIISSAADLQFKLANDGFAQRYESPYTNMMPKGTHWRDELFGFSLEPIVIVYNQTLISEQDIPKSHLGLIEILEEVDSHQNNLANDRVKLSTYDISKSGVGYLISTQDAIISSDFWRLANALNSPRVELLDNSTQILSDLSEGKIAIAYNVLGAYAYAKSLENSDVKVILPEDYVLVLPRTAMISQIAKNKIEAEHFMDFLLSPEGQYIAANHPGLGAILENSQGPWTIETIANNTKGVMKLLELTPTLMVGLDQYKKDKFIQNWLSLVTN